MSLLIFLFLLHWLGDFVLQTPWMACNKSKNCYILGLHVLVYTAVFAVGLGLTMGPSSALLIFLLANLVIHFAVDAVTSRVSARLKDTAYFWWSLGFDQFLHAATLIVLGAACGLQLTF